MLIYNGHVQAVPVSVEDFAAARVDDRTRLTWRLDRRGVDALREIRVEDAPGEQGPWAQRATLRPEASMRWDDPRTNDESRWYRLVLVQRDGAQSLVGPVHADANAVPRVTLDPPSDAGAGGIVIRYTIGPEREPVRLDVYDVAGRRIRTLVDTVQPAGRYRIEWNHADAAGAPVASGVYVVHLRGGHVQASRKVVVRSR